MKLEKSIERAIAESKRLQRDNEILSAKVDTMELFRQTLNSNSLQIGGYAQERDPVHELELCFEHAKMMERTAKPSGIERYSKSELINALHDLDAARFAEEHIDTD